ncbi:MAG: TonB-dependent receptor, partial [Pseudomonadota bacterium]
QIFRAIGRHAVGEAGELSWRFAWNNAQLQYDEHRWFVGSENLQTAGYTLTDDAYIVLDRPGVVDFSLAGPIIDEAEVRAKSAVEQGVAIGADYQHALFSSFDVKIGGQWRRTERDNDILKDRYDTSSGAQAPAISASAVFKDTPVGEVPFMDISAAQLEAQVGGTIRSILPYNALESFVDSVIEDYSITEAVSAAYVMGEYDKGPLTIVGGVRMEHTEQELSGNSLTADLFRGRPTMDSIAANKREHDDTSWLPMVAATYRPTPEWAIRAGAGKRLGRADFDLIAPRAGVDIDRDEITLRVSNPELKPRKSTNYDLSVEYYPSEGQVFGVSFFRRDIKDDIISRTDEVTREVFSDELSEFNIPESPIFGFFERFFVGTVDNIQSYQVDGVEIFAATTIPKVPAPFDQIHLHGTVTFIDENGEISRDGRTEPASLPEQTDMTASFAVSYEDERTTLWAGYRYNGGYLSSLKGRVRDDLYQSESHTLDAKVKWQVSDRWTFLLDGRNLTDELQFEYQSPDVRQKSLAERFGRRVYTGFQYKW